MSCSCSSLTADVDLSALGIFNAKHYGATGDGSTDDTVTIQTAINAAYEAGGGRVLLPKGRYLVNGGLIAKGSVPGDTMGAQCYGTTPIPTGIQWAPNSDLAAGYAGPNFPDSLNPGNGGTLPENPDGSPAALPNGPLILFDNVELVGEGPGITVLLAGDQIYDGWIFDPQGQRYPAPGGPLVPRPQLGAVVVSWNNWAAWPISIPSGTGYPADGFAAHNCYVRDLTVDCQGGSGANAGKPLHIYNSETFEDVPNAPPYNDGPDAIQYAAGADPTIPQGQLYGSAVLLQSVENCGYDNVEVINGNVNGLTLTGTENVGAHANGPVPISYQQLTPGNAENPNGLEIYVPPGNDPVGSNVPTVNGHIRKCRVDLNFPQWLAGTPSETGHGHTGGSNGALPIRSIGCAAVEVTGNRVGARNKPSDFGQFAMPEGYSNYPDVPPNTNDAMDCPGSWHIVVRGNLLTNCGDGIGSEGNGDMLVSDNLIYNFGSVAIDAPSNSGKTVSQTIISDNIIFLSSDSGAPQIGINIDEDMSDDTTDEAPNASGQNFGSGDSSKQATSQQGDVIISGNILYAPGNSIMINLKAWGAVVKGNIFDFAAGGLQGSTHTPYNNPVVNPEDLPGQGSPGWPSAARSGIQVKGNGIVIEGNIFRNAAPAGTINAAVAGIVFPSAFPPPYQPGDSTHVIIKGNLFDGTIGDPILDSASGSLQGVRILDNIGVNPVGALDPSLVPVPDSGHEFSNPYAYDCLVEIVATDAAVSVTLYGVAFGTIPTGQSKSFLVKAGGTIILSYNILLPAPSWVWVGL